MNSWKEIGAFFDKDVRTVRRWEAVRGLPIHRVPGGQRGGVYAYVEELEHWLAGRGAVEEAPSVPGDEIYSNHDSGETQAFAPEPEPRPEPRPEPKPEPGLTLEAGTTSEDAAKPGHARKLWAWIAVATLLVTAAVVAGFRFERNRSAEVQSLNATLSNDAEAQELYLRAQYLWNQQTEASLTEAADLYRQAIAKDANFAAAYAGLADSYILLRQYGRMADGEAFPKALAASRQALKLDDRSPEAHRAYAFVLNYWIWDFPAAEKEFQQAILLRPADSQTHHWYATSLFSVGRYEDALREIDTARRLKPDSIAILANRGLLLTPVDEGAALKYLLQVERVNTGFAPVHTYLADIYLARGEFDAYFEESGKAAVLQHRDEAAAVLEEAKTVRKRDGMEAMLRVLAEGFGRTADAGVPNAMQAAGFWVRAGDNDRALHYLGVACDRRDPAFLGIDHDAVFKPLAGDARFIALVRGKDTPMVVGGGARTLS